MQRVHALRHMTESTFCFQFPEDTERYLLSELHKCKPKGLRNPSQLQSKTWFTWIFIHASSLFYKTFASTSIVNWKKKKFCMFCSKFPIVEVTHTSIFQVFPRKFPFPGGSRYSTVISGPTHNWTEFIRKEPTQIFEKKRAKNIFEFL